MLTPRVLIISFAGLVSLVPVHRFYRTVRAAYDPPGRTGSVWSETTLSWRELTRRICRGADLIQRARAPFLESPETFRAYFG